ncbi:MAG: hypothetical protein FJX76_29065, partial [Armatimonadetes bacterium]|nr:hypothetical protein [Armatimonadota bacterium]
MPEPLPGRTPPFEVTAGYHPFVDLRFVYAGRPRWVGPEGQALSMWGLDKPARVQDAHVAVPRGIGLAVHPAERSAPILTCTEPWEHANGGPTIIRDGGLYRMWYHAIPPDFWDPARGGTLTWGPDYGGVLCYAESDDGLAWRKPKLGLYRWQGRDDTNIVFGRELAGPPGLHGISVFLDPSAPAHERYKALYVAPIESDAAREWVRRHPDATDPWVATEHRQQAVYVATSPDGLRWTPFPEPVLLYFSDTKNVVN